jgi:IMP dehydrogenase/GMP reductase
MEKKLQTLYGLNDITIIPEKLTDIRSRKQCFPHYIQEDVYDGDFRTEHLPIFCAPMSCVIDENNWSKFHTEELNVVIPRSVNYNKRVDLCYNTFCAFSLNEFKSLIDNLLLNNKNGYTGNKMYICIDLANGHMKHLYELCKFAKNFMGDKISIMTGNIANPETYLEIGKMNCIDYIRIGIGTGNVCTTSANTAVHYPMASLIMKCKEYKDEYDWYEKFKFPKIIADGGFKNFDQIIKALALGADYVMLGDILARTEEACGKEVKKVNWRGLLNGEMKLFKRYREYYGMSTRKAQKEFGSEGKKTAEGITKLVPIQYTLKGWVSNFKSFLSSAMSYTNFQFLEDFVGGPQTGLMTNSAFGAYYK